MSPKNKSTYQLPLTPPSSTVKRRGTSNSCLEPINVNIKPKKLLSELKKSSQLSSPASPCKIRKITRKPTLKYRPIVNTIFNVQDYLDGISKSKKDNEKNLEFLKCSFKYSNKIIVIAGAGISTATGIPDFRSNSSSKEGLLMNKETKSLFDYNYVYSNDDSIEKFNKLMNHLNHLSNTVKPTKFHHFLNDLLEKNKIQRIYTQNIDGLEKKAVSSNYNNKIVQLHGDINFMTCNFCHIRTSYDPTLFENQLIPDCLYCMENQMIRRNAGLRARSIGKFRPSIVLYNELHPSGEEIMQFNKIDLKKFPDLLVIVGTTLKIPGVISMVKNFVTKIKSRKNGIILFIANELPSQRIIDIIGHIDLIVLGDCQAIPDLVE
ncbi:NAD-dependent histone deacetylase HST4 NDAI_0B05490 [Naumovozyma dairenensis CBS 421]|uniref:Deacetylase sirtuin-type domain-containing protein n=1 Tax=Naumovozyma dairenensis (strain ATCC 10597 / BCRC 20456 / CBS 421 / NBRC 0211 / NRRL Y-12639) TaxID=1071378 RepID=G0W721_NAUDC|nr:hypothetical protein NDAI_0B05490 [Naumovozyma dairenensis CBS 421]CCD23582.1 hypothetical protein NDAI_0B05490 [Naumovozyma dairenensis CBS 421]